MRTYTLLTREQRYQLSTLLKMGHSQIEIAEVTGMNNMKYLSKNIVCYAYSFLGLLREKSSSSRGGT